MTVARCGPRRRRIVHVAHAVANGFSPHASRWNGRRERQPLFQATSLHWDLREGSCAERSVRHANSRHGRRA
jgi:hypothetical protein